MTFPIRHGQIESWKYGHPQNHELEELMQNGIFFAGDDFDIKISSSTLQNENIFL